MTDATDYPLFDHVLNNLRSAILDIAHQPSRASESAFEGVERHQEQFTGFCDRCRREQVSSVSCYRYGCSRTDWFQQA